MKPTTNAIAVAGSTLVGYCTDEYPIEYGNCFSVATEDGKNYRILNFGLENLEHLLAEKGLTWPVKIVVLGERHAALSDERIGDRWYWPRFCSVCTPRDLIPLPQLLENDRDEARGTTKRTLVEMADGQKFEMVSTKISRPAAQIP